MPSFGSDENSTYNPLVKGDLDEEPSVSEPRKIQCPECGSLRQVRDYKRAEIICCDCGLVIEDKIIDSGPEWRAFDTDQTMSRERTGAPMTYTIHDKGLSTMIDDSDRDIFGRSLSPETKAQMYRLRKWNKRARVSNSVERNLSYALSELDRVAAQLQLPKNVREAASMIYRKTVEKDLIRGRSIESSTASAIYISCRQFGIPRTLEELSEVTKHNKKEIGKSYRVIARGLTIHLPPINAIDYVPRFTSELGLPGTVETKAIEILRQVINEGLGSGKGPTGIAAAAIYIACVLEDVKRTQKEISDITGVTEVTVRNRYKEIAEYLNLDVD